jgi:predicted cupin superfamily sugar epimerase
MTASKLIQSLQLQPLPGEGGYYRETYRSRETDAHSGRAQGTAIYFLITPGQFSSLHRLPFDEIWHFYLGDPVEQIRVWEDGRLETHTLSNRLDLDPSYQPQTVVPAGAWQASRLAEGGRYALLGTTMAPGFDFDDLELANAEALRLRFPHLADTIRQYAPNPTPS